MNYEFKFSIIVAVYNVENYLKESIESVINQTLNFKENIQLILVDDGSSDNSLQIASDYQEKYPENILVLSKQNGGQASARNLGLEHAKGKYVNFLDSDDYISLNTLEEVYNFFEEHFNEIDIIAIPMMLFERVEGPHRLNYKFNENKVINLTNEPNNPILSSSSSFIKHDAIKDYKFDTNLVNLEDALVINKILLDKKQYGVINTCRYYYRQRILRDSTVDSINSKKAYFTSRLKNFYMKLIDYCLSKEGNVPYFIQYLMAYDLQWLLKTPNLEVFDNKDEIDEFWIYLKQTLSYIDEKVVFDNENISEDIQSFFLFLLGNEKAIAVDDEGSIGFYVGKYEMDTLDEHRIWLDIVKVKGNVLNISGVFLSNFDNDFISLRLIKKSRSDSPEEYPCKQIKYNTIERNNKSFLGIEWKYCYNFDVEAPLLPNKDYDLDFIVDYMFEEQKYSFELSLGLNYSVNLSKYGAYILDYPYIILFKFNKLYIKRYSFLSVLRYEYSNLKSMIIDKPDFYRKAISIRLLYLILYFFIRNKKIWIFSDRPDFADDNAKYLFNYAIDENDGIDKYFVVNKDSSSFIEMKKSYNNIVPFGSLKHKILFLFSQKVISSYVNEGFINPFYNTNLNLYKGLSHEDRLFLQHGVTKDDISKFIKKYNQDLSLIVTVSDFEKESFLKEGYNYDESIIPVLGFPRFDQLVNKSSKKQILFMPTWRLQLENDSDFANSAYFEYLHNFLNDSKLFELLNSYGYKLVFKPHPELQKYLDLVNINEEVVVSFDDSYQELFNSSSLLITDYSSVFFDFAFLKKPIIYYHPYEDYHYEKGYFDYESMGFGDVIKDYDNLIIRIDEYLKNNCEMELDYKNAVDNFFKFNDNQNSKRVYDWIVNH